MQIRWVVLLIIVLEVMAFSSWLHLRLKLTEQSQDLRLSKTQKANTAALQKALASCPESPPRLVGPLHVKFDWNRTMEAVRAELNSSLQEGGRYTPPDCISPHKVCRFIDRSRVLACL